MKTNFQNVEKKEMTAGFMSLDLKRLKREASEIAGGWNGKDDQFNVNGTTYSEDDAHHAIEVMEACEQLEDLLTVK